MSPRLLLLCFWLILAPLVSFPAFGDNTWLSIKVTGVKGKLARNIRAHLGADPESDVQRRAYLFTAEDNITAALESLGRYHSSVELTVIESDSEPWQLQIAVTPGEPTLVQWVDIQFSGEMRSDDAFNLWLDSITLLPGDTLNHGRYLEIKSQLTTLALTRGYFDAEYTLAEIQVNRDLNSARISLHFDSGKRYQFDEVTFSGHSLDDDLLQTLVPFDADMPYASSQLSALHRNLLDSGYFSSIKVLPQIDKIHDNLVPIKVELTDRNSHSFEVGVGADIGNTSEKSVEPRVRFTWRTPQINHLGHSQETSLEWSPDRPKFLTTYSIPLTHVLNDKLNIRLGLLRDKYGVTQDYLPTEKTFANTGQLESSKQLFGLVRQQKLDNQWLWSYSLEAVHEEYNQLNQDFNPKIYLLGMGFSRSLRGDNSLDPKSGFRQIYHIEHADGSLGSSLSLTRLQSRFKWIDTLFDNHRFVARLDLAANLADTEDMANIPPSLRYFAGGDQSIRGYGYQELGPHIEYTNAEGGTSRQVVGGRYLAVASVEYQYYLTPTWRLASFIDGGNAFDTKQFDPVLAVGSGVHWISPIGPIKLDLGVGLKETDTVARSWRIHLTMGTEL
ncbi:surface antigen (D15) [Shewanella denitrificans OS217]|jgi:translocation and assembly module TamA|uniref:Translocation and assembly module subunit TamA n=1 Tax=Shewanella denitrificans (strain OS217 / ATCC BAA-1090 / DSM 15013) TaxID=318161 RepID=Q12P36_SHEDO|nr:autotransporter assembly complex family protein [Shewanella denitrificans]ABE54790.1 surface antigen (D15) [Shewanella denitrificans OS217]